MHVIRFCGTWELLLLLLLDEGVLGWLKQPAIMLFNSFYTDRTMCC